MGEGGRVTTGGQSMPPFPPGMFHRRKRKGMLPGLVLTLLGHSIKMVDRAKVDLQWNTQSDRQ